MQNRTKMFPQNVRDSVSIFRYAGARIQNKLVGRVFVFGIGYFIRADQKQSKIT